MLNKDDTTYGLSTLATNKSTQNEGSGNASDKDSKVSDDGSDIMSVGTKFTKGSASTGLSEMTNVSWDTAVVDKEKPLATFTQAARLESKLQKEGFSQQDFVDWKEKNAKRVEDVYCINKNKYQAAKQLILLMIKDRKDLSEESGPKDPWGSETGADTYRQIRACNAEDGRPKQRSNRLEDSA